MLVRVEAAPINPSDLGLLFGAADMSTARLVRHAGQPRGHRDAFPDALMTAMAGRLDQSMPVGNEGAGVVVAAGSSAAAQALLGKTVAVLGGAMYSQYRVRQGRDSACVLPAGTTPAEGASCFVNPLTALGMVETMRREGHTALVHTAAASNLGPDAQPDLPQGRDRPGEHRAQAGAGRPAAGHRRGARLQLQRRRRSWRT